LKTEKTPGKRQFGIKVREENHYPRLGEDHIIYKEYHLFPKFVWFQLYAELMKRLPEPAVNIEAALRVFLCTLSTKLKNCVIMC